MSVIPLFSQVFTYANDNQTLSCEKNTYYFEDKTKGLNFENIHKLPDKAFKKSADSTVNFGITESVIWVYFDLKNFTDEWPLFKYSSHSKGGRFPDFRK